MQEREVSSTVTVTFAVPAATAVTVPEELTVATLVSLEEKTGVPEAPLTESLKLSCEEAEIVTSLWLRVMPELEPPPEEEPEDEEPDEAGADAFTRTMHSAVTSPTVAVIVA
jgi:hypothetical protein